MLLSTPVSGGIFQPRFGARFIAKVAPHFQRRSCVSNPAVGQSYQAIFRSGFWILDFPICWFRVSWTLGWKSHAVHSVALTDTLKLISCHVSNISSLMFCPVASWTRTSSQIGQQRVGCMVEHLAPLLRSGSSPLKMEQTSDSAFTSASSVWHLYRVQATYVYQKYPGWVKHPDFAQQAPRRDRKC